MKVSFHRPKVELAVKPRVPDDFLDLFMASAHHYVTRKSHGGGARRSPEEIGEKGSSCPCDQVRRPFCRAEAERGQIEIPRSAVSHYRLLNTHDALSCSVIM